jgi:hypothetical protein
MSDNPSVQIVDHPLFLGSGFGFALLIRQMAATSVSTRRGREPSQLATPVNAILNYAYALLDTARHEGYRAGHRAARRTSRSSATPSAATSLSMSRLYVAPVEYSTSAHHLGGSQRPQF